MELRNALIEFNSLAYGRNVWTEADREKLERIFGEIRFRIMPNTPENEELLVQASCVYAAATQNHAKGVLEAGYKFTMAVQKKLHSDLRSIEEQVWSGKIT